jgi:hypothetical protein
MESKKRKRRAGSARSLFSNHRCPNDKKESEKNSHTKIKKAEDLKSPAFFNYAF